MKHSARVTSGVQQRILAAYSGGTPSSKTVDELANIVHRVLEVAFERQGFDASRHFLADPDSTETFEERDLGEITIEQMQIAGLDPKKNHDQLLAIRSALRGVFYNGRTFCGRLARTYVLLFMICNTPEIINYFNSMSKHLSLFASGALWSAMPAGPALAIKRQARRAAALTISTLR